MPTARTLVTDGLSLVGIQAAEEPLTAHQEQQGLRILNDLIHSASLEQFVIYSMEATVIPWAADSLRLTWGPGGDIPTSPPVQLGLEAFRQDGVPVMRTPIAVLTPPAFREMSQGVVRHGQILAVTYTAGMPLGGLHCWPVPTEPTTIIVYPWQTLHTWPDFDTDILLPPGYDRYLKSAFAVDIAPFYEKEASPTVMAMRAESKNSIKTVHVTIPVLDVPWFADPWMRQWA